MSASCTVGPVFDNRSIGMIGWLHMYYSTTSSRQSAAILDITTTVETFPVTAVDRTRCVCCWGRDGINQTRCCQYDNWCENWVPARSISSAGLCTTNMCCISIVVLVAVYVARQAAELDQINAQRFAEICNSLVRTKIDLPTSAHQQAMLSLTHSLLRLTSWGS